MGTWGNRILKFHPKTDPQQIRNELIRAYKSGKSVVREADGSYSIGGLTDQELEEAQKYISQKWNGRVLVREHTPRQAPRMADIPMKDRW